MSTPNPIANRILVAQPFAFIPLLVQSANPTPINSAITLTNLITSFGVNNPSANANSVFLGNQAVTTASGWEIKPGVPQIFPIDNQGRQLYELQFPILQLTEFIICQPQRPTDIPYIVWDISQLYLIAAAAPTTVTIALFQQAYM